MQVQKPFFDELKRDEGDKRLCEGRGLEDGWASTAEWSCAPRSPK